jgi:hypothetical protein
MTAGEERRIDLETGRGSATFFINELEIEAVIDNCWEPALTPAALCNTDDGSATFSVTNEGGPMLDPTEWQIVDGDGQSVDTGMLQLNNGETFETTVSDVAGTLTFSVLEYDLTVSTICFEDADITLQAWCNDDASATFSILNQGGDMAANDQSIGYVVTDINGNTLEEGTLVLGEDQTELLNFSNVSEAIDLTITLSTGQTATASVRDCLVPDETPTPSPTPPTEDVCGEIEFNEYGFPVTDMDPTACEDTSRPPEDWEPITGGGNVCVDWLIYHTDQTEDWEIFRLGGDDQLMPGSNPNLSQGVGEGVFDIAPSRSPDARWITFTSTRDGNWKSMWRRLNRLAPMASQSSVVSPSTRERLTSTRYGHQALNMMAATGLPTNQRVMDNGTCTCLICKPARKPA